MAPSPGWYCGFPSEHQIPSNVSRPLSQINPEKRGIQPQPRTNGFSKTVSWILWRDFDILFDGTDRIQRLRSWRVGAMRWIQGKSEQRALYNRYQEGALYKALPVPAKWFRYKHGSIGGFSFLFLEIARLDPPNWDMSIMWLKVYPTGTGRRHWLMTHSYSWCNSNRRRR